MTSCWASGPARQINNLTISNSYLMLLYPGEQSVEGEACPIGCIVAPPKDTQEAVTSTIKALLYALILTL